MYLAAWEVSISEWTKELENKLSIIDYPLVFATLQRKKRTFTPVYRGHGLRIASWNVDSLRVKLKSPQWLVTFVTGEAPDILFLQETKLAANQDLAHKCVAQLVELFPDYAVHCLASEAL